MPYRLDPSDARCVQVKRGGSWERVEGGCHGARDEALAHLRALQANVDKAEFTGEFAKLDDERRLAFGWAYVANEDGMVVLDHSEDFVDKAALPDLEDAVYEYALVSRDADEMHARTEGVGKLVESVILTPEKMDKMGVKSGRAGWWVGFKVMDDAVWKKVKDGTYTMFSIRGSGTRETVDAPAT